MSIVLRPHHLLCTQGYSGKGYDNDFVAHMTDVVHQLRDVPGTTIHLTFSTDTLCSCCPNKLGTDLCDTQEKVKRYDAKTVEYFGLEEKDYVYQDLIREIDVFIIHCDRAVIATITPIVTRILLIPAKSTLPGPTI